MKTIRSSVGLAILGLGLLAFGAGCEKSASQGDAGKQKYTCPMHPEVVQDAPGKCPKCGMTLEIKK